MDLRNYDWIVINSSAGKDSQAMLDVVATLAREQDVTDRVVVVHCDLGRVEWKGTRELAEEQARHYGLRFEVVSRPQGDLLTHVETKGLWPSSAARYCTSDHKRGQVDKLFTQLVRESNTSRPVRILNAMGIRAQESDNRERCTACKAKQPAQRRCSLCKGTGARQPLVLNTRASNGKRDVFEWLPILDWTVEQVWARIAQAGTRVHDAYAIGMKRLSCCFCIMAPKHALVLAGQHNPELLAEYVRVEQKIGHRFTVKLSLVEVQAAVDATACSAAA